MEEAKQLIFLKKLYILVNGKIIYDTDKEQKNTLLVKIIRVNTELVPTMVEVFIYGKTVRNILASSDMVVCMEKGR